ncbi:hypothetical protein DYBT9275_02857 [Dyadobacter sp. CECT 9275]|uniref:Uncharacterized protein n=1 Tax=Dyadobacter helix TaxID=2822344 RepID=A0A916NLQ9_9BACT|nr:hypothetical protein DYBT9275_02857 [Dyadobacter sp. CECT 9275]
MTAIDKDFQLAYNWTRKHQSFNNIKSYFASILGLSKRRLYHEST